MAYDFDRLIDRRSSNSIKWKKYPEDVLPVWVADMDFQAPPPVLDALQDAVEHGIFGYEALPDSLRQAVVARMDQLYGWQVSPEAVVATPGIVTAFNLAARAVCAAGEGILMQPPVYFPFLHVHEHVGLVRQLAPLRQVNKAHTLHYEIDWDVFEDSIHSNEARTRMFLLCQPHNPTGQVYSRDDLLRMAELCEREDIVICSDEIHSELLLSGTQHEPMAILSPEIEARTITLIAPSKTFNVAGLFCGFAIIPNPELRRRFEKEVERLTVHVSSPGFVSAEAAFSGQCEEWLSELRTYLTANRDFMVDFIRQRLPGIRTTVPQATYLAWLDCSDLVAAGIIGENPHQFFLKQAKVALNDGSEFGPGGEGFVRFNFGCPRSILVEALERMESALSLP
jgi:cystathionine beta-lyase